MGRGPMRHRRLVHPDSVLLEPERELGAGAGHDDLIDEPAALQLPGEQPHLTLPAAPLAAGRDVDDGGGHVSGSASSGRLSRRRRWPAVPGDLPEQAAELGEAERLVQVGSVERSRGTPGCRPARCRRC